MVQDESAAAGVNAIQALVALTLRRLSPDAIDEIDAKIESAPTKANRNIGGADPHRHGFTKFWSHGVSLFSVRGPFAVLQIH